MERLVGKLFKNEKDAIAMILVTLYIGLKIFIQNNYTYLLNFDHLDKTLLILANILNEMILAFIPFGVIILTFDGAKYKASLPKERLIVCFMALIFIPLFIVIYQIILWFENIFYYNNSLPIVKQLIFLLTQFTHWLIIVITIFTIVMFLSILVNNFIMFVLLLVDNKLKSRDTVEVTKNMELENTFINIHNYWYRYKYSIVWNPYKSEREIYFVKTFVKSQKNSEILITIYSENGELIIPKQYTNIYLVSKIKVAELEKKVDTFIEEKLIAH